MLKDYLPETLADDRLRFPTIDAVTTILGDARVEPVPIPADCKDGSLDGAERGFDPPHISRLTAARSYG